MKVTGWMRKPESESKNIKLRERASSFVLGVDINYSLIAAAARRIDLRWNNIIAFISKINQKERYQMWRSISMAIILFSIVMDYYSVMIMRSLKKTSQNTFWENTEAQKAHHQTFVWEIDMRELWVCYGHNSDGY